MGLGRIIGSLFGRAPAVATADPALVPPDAAAPVADSDLLRLWRAQRCLQSARVNALRDVIAGTPLVPPYVDAPDPYVPRLRDVDAILTTDSALLEWLSRHDPALRRPGWADIDSDGIVVGPAEGRVRLRLPRLDLGSGVDTPPHDAAVVEVFTLDAVDGPTEVDRTHCAARYPNARHTSLRATERPTIVDMGSALPPLRLTILEVTVARRRTPCAVLDHVESGDRAVLCASLPRALLFSAPPGLGGPAPRVVVGGLAIRPRRSGDARRVSPDTVDTEPDDDTTRASVPFERGLTATQAASRLGRRSRSGLADRLHLERLVILTAARGVDAGGSVAMACALGLSAEAIGPSVFVPPSAADALEGLCGSGDDEWTAPNDLDATHVTAAILVGDAPASVLARLRDGLAAAEPAAAFARGLLHEAEGDLERAVAAYEDAADVDPRADEQLLVLNDRLGQAIPPDELLSDDPPVLPTLNRALLDWRHGRAAVARAALENADVATLSPIGRAIADELDAGQPASVKLPLVSPALAELLDPDVACAFLRGGETTRGVALLERALDLEPLAVGAAATLATHLIRTGSPDAALHVLARVMQAGPHTGTGLTAWTDGHGLRCEALANLGRDDDALAALAQVIDATSARVEARLTRIALLDRLGRTEEARADAARLSADGADALLTRRVHARLRRP
ncbi:MAG: hypothetical protein IV100_31390 [Myxococcales bacterium]|nr:hypothetical protein [Myxococcales bacterium]